MVMLEKNDLKKIVGEDTLWCIFSQVTRHPFLYCDPETNEDQVLLFTEEERLEDEAQQFLDMRYAVTKVKIRDTDKRKFMLDLQNLGVTEVVYVSKEDVLHVQLDEILTHPDLIEVSKWNPLPDWDKAPENMRPLTNPSLQTTVCYFAQELHRDVTPEEKKIGISYHIEEFESNMARCQFLVPVLPNSNVPVSAVKQLSIDQVGFMMLNDPEKNQWMPIFSDHMEFAIFNSQKKLVGINMNLAQLMKVLPKEAKGLLLNANHVSMQLQTPLLKQILEKNQE